MTQLLGTPFYARRGSRPGEPTYGSSWARRRAHGPHFSFRARALFASCGFRVPGATGAAMRVSESTSTRRDKCAGLQGESGFSIGQTDVASGEFSQLSVGTHAVLVVPRSCGTVGTTSLRSRNIFAPQPMADGPARLPACALS